MEILAIIYQIEITLLFLYSIFLGGKNKNAIQKYLFIYLFVTNAIEILSLIGKSYLNLPTNGIIYNFYSLFCLSFFYFFYAGSFVKKSKLIFLGLYCLAIACTVFFIDFLKFEYDYKIGIILAMFYMCSALFWMGYRIVNVDNRKITSHPKFWVSVGLILWSSFFILRSIPMYLFEKIDEEFQNMLRTIFYIINIAFYILFFIALLKSKKILDEKSAV
ncbi:hypothetical protein [Chryseobacterium sp. GP-SGM7]|uniref:hypothetical protein n=1 Tax=Chryseobacterium sp. GP-SGM7 TaxID=3411323 RepID=UPI003B922637